MTANNHNVDTRIGKELGGLSIVLGLWIVDGAMSSRLCGGRICWRSRSLQKSIDLEIGVGQYERQMEALGRESFNLVSNSKHPGKAGILPISYEANV